MAAAKPNGHQEGVMQDGVQPLSKEDLRTKIEQVLRSTMDDSSWNAELQHFLQMQRSRMLEDMQRQLTHAISKWALPVPEVVQVQHQPDEDSTNANAKAPEPPFINDVEKARLDGLRTRMSNTSLVVDEDEAETPTFQLSGMSGNLDAPKTWADSLREKAVLERPGGVRNTVLKSLARCVHRIESIQEPKRHGCLASIIAAYQFDLMSMLAIGMNTIFIAFSTNYEISHLGDGPTSGMKAIEIALAAFYVVELILKLSVHRLYFFVNGEMGWNWLDFVLVIFSTVELLATYTSDGSSGGGMNIGFLRVVRLCKIAKVLRIFRALKFFTELRLMVDCVIGSVINAFWCLVMLLFVIFVFSLVIVQSTAGYLDDQYMAGSFDETVQPIRDILHYFGSVEAGVLTLLMSTTAGIDWRDAYVPLAGAGGLLPAVFVTYIILFTISIWNIVTGTFVEKAMKLAVPDFESMAFDQAAADSAELRLLVKMFNGGKVVKDTDNAGTMNYSQFREFVSNDDFRSYLNARSMDIKNIEVFFQMLSSHPADPDEPDKGVDIRLLAQACVRMKGFATSIDLMSLTFETKMNSAKQAKLLKQLTNHIARMEKLLVEPSLKSNLKSQIARSSLIIGDDVPFDSPDVDAAKPPAFSL